MILNSVSIKILCEGDEKKQNLDYIRYENHNET